MSGAVPTLTQSDRLHVSLRYANITQETLARRMGLTDRMVRYWMGSNPRTPTREQFAEMAEILGVDRAWLETGQEDHE